MRYVIIGSGEAGLRAARRLRQSADDVTIVHAEPSVPYERPRLSKPDAQGNAHKAIVIDLSGVNVLQARSAASIDRRNHVVVLDDGEQIPYDRLLIATGAVPRRLAEDPSRIAKVLRTDVDALAIYSAARAGGDAVIIGAGLIGLEMAAELTKRGMKVRVLELGPVALGRAIPRDIADLIVARHLAAGVEFHFSVAIKSIDADGVSLMHGRQFGADLVVSAIGVLPETDLALRSGLECDNGILVDALLRTSDNHIFAAGDCANVNHPRYGRVRLETWRNACDQGGHAATTMMGGTEEFNALPWFWSDQHELGLQAVGLHDPKNTAVRRHSGDELKFRFELDSSGRLSAAFGVGVGNAAAREIKIAEKLIMKGATIDPTLLADPASDLKQLLSASR
ncbi:NAD(P)/FAD-dependent oxidoreductase [Rhizobium leguminosarum]